MNISCLEHRKNLFIFGSIFAVASAVYLLNLILQGNPTEAGMVYFPYAETLLNGTIPDIEYPPFAIPFFFIPGLFASTPEGYGIMFSIEAYIFFAIGLVLADKFAKFFEVNRFFSMLVYTIMMLVMIEFIIDRYDVFPIILSMASLYCFMTKRYFWAWVLLSIATMTKLYPVVIAPVYLIMLLTDRDWKKALNGIFVFALTAFAIVLPIMLAGSDVMSYFIGYHMDRPLQVESTAASIISFISLFGLTSVTVDFSFGSDNLFGVMPDAVAPYLTPLTMVLLLAFYLLLTLFTVKMKKEGLFTEENKILVLIVAAFVSVSIFILAGKVFSTQYTAWLIPMALLLSILALKYPYLKPMFLAFTIAEFLTILNFAVNIRIYGGDFNAPGTLILVVRNILMIAITVWLIKRTREHILTKKQS